MANPDWPGYRPPRGHIEYQTPFYTPFGRGRGRGRARGGRGRVLLVRGPYQRYDENVIPASQDLEDRTLHTASAKTQQSLPSQPLRILNASGIDFEVSSDGQTLTRVTPADTPPETPQELLVGRVTFHRSKNGNKMFRNDKFQELVAKKERKAAKEAEKAQRGLCPRFQLTGNCPSGPKCMYTHNPNKVAICKDFLFNGTCSKGQGCDLSHNSTANRTPACIYFSRGHCTNDSCRYTHVKIDSGANVCRDFATFGWCEKGATCTERHVFECPDYANAGSCSTPRCHLPHVDRAGQLRKLTGVENNIPTPPTANASSTSNSDKDDKGADGIDSDNPDLNSFSQQEDYIRLDADE